MKTTILMTSAGAAGVATVIGLTAVLTQGGGISEAELMSGISTTFRLYQAAGILGLLSIATFFVGLAYPTGSTVTAGVKSKRGN